METLSLIYFSPTGTTQKIVREIGQKTGLKLISENNITHNQDEFKPAVSGDCLTIIGIPVYGGRVPIEAIEALKKLQSNQSPVVIVVVYGNREYDDALLELKEVAINCGFRIIAGAAFIGEHSFSSKDKPIAKNRPDKQDLIKCRDFAELINKKLNEIRDANTPAELNVPGKYPYKERKQLPATVHPITDNNLCNQCGTCVDICPVNAITIEGTEITNGELCTWCCACVKHCPNEARIFDNPTINAVKKKLFLNCSIRKEPVYFV
ncbi:MAG: EFR1 family ferrodoxin [Marinilabiliaceae bacterium]|nr:EFR1 family ferrodoxin [Marinilabiliaceae bacterium]MBI9065035.1 EFR1 family ferrodoxin [Marinilabiliaceae bacterium]